jgi:FkbM family methyltransferase
MIRDIIRESTPPFVLRILRQTIQRWTEPSRVAEEAELARLRQMPSIQAATTNIGGRRFHVVDGKSFAHLYDMFFRKQIYRFEADNDHPFIIDCGAHVGVSVSWWKEAYPNARVLAFEPDPSNFRLLQQNCGHLPNVHLINAAVWTKEDTIPFLAAGGEGGHIAEPSTPMRANPLRLVRCVSLRPFLKAGCDLLKMDIEGAEIDVIRDCADVLGSVARMFVEYHSFVDKQQRLGETLSLLEQAGFRFHIGTKVPSPRPFEELVIFNEKDLRLDLFCWRERTQPRSHSIG